MSPPQGNVSLQPRGTHFSATQNIQIFNQQAAAARAARAGGGGGGGGAKPAGGAGKAQAGPSPAQLQRQQFQAQQQQNRFQFARGQQAQRQNFQASQQQNRQAYQQQQKQLSGRQKAIKGVTEKVGGFFGGVAEWIGNLPQYGGIAGLLLVLFFLLMVIIPVNGKRTRLNLIFLTLLGKTSLPVPTPSTGGDTSSDTTGASVDNSAPSPNLPLPPTSADQGAKAVPNDALSSLSANDPSTPRSYTLPPSVRRLPPNTGGFS